MSTVMKAEERLQFSLRSLYKKYGYLPYKMNKFEAYDLYASNKDFLRGDGVITFTDTDGKLLALKPDVTLSIVKNGNDELDKQKVHYNENVYRVSGETKQFKEIMQVGLECIGNVDLYDVYETVCIAVESLREISQNCVLDLSHIGLIEGFLEEAGVGESFAKKYVEFLSGKNAHSVASLCEEYGVASEKAEKLLQLIRIYGEMQSALEKLQPLCTTEKEKRAFDELFALCNLLKTSGYLPYVRLDFSVVNNRKYYNGLVFKGFVEGAFEGVLSGGQYDLLMQRMGRKSRAIGFAVYVDAVERIGGQNRASFDVDTLVLYDVNTPIEEVVSAVREQQTDGKSVRAQTTEKGLRFNALVDLRK